MDGNAWNFFVSSNLRKLNFWKTEIILCKSLWRKNLKYFNKINVSSVPPQIVIFYKNSLKSYFFTSHKNYTRKCCTLNFSLMLSLQHKSLQKFYLSDLFQKRLSCVSFAKNVGIVNRTSLQNWEIKKIAISLWFYMREDKSHTFNNALFCHFKWICSLLKFTHFHFS
jgi:hypothetical protein